MPVDATAETFKELTSEGSVFVDFWGPRCQPCLAMMPTIKDLEEEAAGAVRVVKVDSTQNRDVCRELRVFGLPTYILMRDGEELERLSGGGSIRDAERRWRCMKLDGKKVIALGERDGVPGPAIAECVRSAGAEPIFVETECFV
jgi:thioredoxin 1